MFSLASFARFFAAKYWVWYVAGIATLLATTAISLYLPQLSKGIINSLSSSGVDVGVTSGNVIADPSGQLFQLSLKDVPLLIIALGVLLTIVRSLSRILIFWPGQKVASDARSWLVRIFLQLRQAEFARFGLGDLVSRMSSDVTHLRLMCGFGLLQIANLSFLLCFALYLMLRTDVSLTFIALAPVSGMLVVTFFGMPYISRYSREQQDVLGVLSNRVTESFSNVQTIQINLATDSFERLVERENQRNLGTSLKLLVVRTLTFPFMVLFSGLAEVLVVFYGGAKVISGAMTVGDILAFNIYVGLLGFPLAAVGIIIGLHQRAKAAIRRLSEIESSPSEKPLVSVAQGSHAAQADQANVLEPDPLALMEFRNVCFAYPGQTHHAALNEVSFAVRHGERIGLCGPVGSGKSTLFSLATRLYDPRPGQIFLRGRDVCDIPFEQLRREVRCMPQTVHLFSDSIRENLVFGLQSPKSDKELEAVCRQAEIWEDITSFHGQLEIPIGERGVRLSGGQRQRLALARMLLRPGAVMLLDDVVSAVDTRTERAILDALFALNTTFVITSHRPETLERCDRVVYLDGGVLVFDGPFSKLKGELRSQLESRDLAKGKSAGGKDGVALEDDSASPFAHQGECPE
jgi:ATP-binding cassette subfamily B protein